MKTLRKFRLAGALAALALVVAFAGYGDVNAASLSSRVQVTLTGNYTSTVGLAEVAAPLASQKIQDFTNGTGANQANVVWTSRRTLTTGASEDLDFAGGGLTDAFGAAVAPVRVKALYITASTANTTNLTLFGDANSILFLNTAATTVTLKPGGTYVYVDPSSAGITVTAATADIIQVANAAGASATYDIVVIGGNS